MLKKFVFALALCAGMVVFGKDWYVDANTTINPDGSQAAPWKLLTDAVANAHDGDVIHLTDGQTHSTAAVTVSAGVTIIGGGDSTLISNSGAITLNHPDAVLKKVKITCGAANSSVALTIKQGTLDDCFVYNCRSGNAKHTTLSISGGTVQNCRFHANQPKSYNGQSYDAPVKVTGPATFGNCLFYGNTFPNGAATAADITTPVLDPPGIVDVDIASGTATFENCTFTDNTGHSAGAVRIKSGAGKVDFRGCVISGNHTYLDIAPRYDYASEDICLCSRKGAVTFEHCLIGKTPENPADVYVFTDCWTGVAAGFQDESAGDYTVVKGSPAYGYGYGAEAMPTDFACAIETPAVDRAADSLTVTLKAKLFNAPTGAATYEWDLDGDDVYETTDKGEGFEHEFTMLGWNKVGLKVTIGGTTREYVCDNFVYIAPKTVYLRQKTNKTTFTPTFPYATEDTAASTLADAYAAAIDGSVIKVLAGSFPASGTSLIKKIEIEGDDAHPANVKLTGAAQSLLVAIGDGVFAHGITFSVGYPVLSMNGGSVVSNCVVTGGSMSTASTGTGLNIIDGLFTHGRIHGNGCSNGGGLGLYILGGTVRNSYIYNNKTSNGTNASYNNAAVKVAGGTVENCTIAKNCAPTTATSGKIGGVEITGKAIFRNNVVWGNTCPHPLTESANNWWVKDGVDTSGIYNNVTETDGLGSDCFTDNPQFTAIDTYDFSITSASGCYNRGANQDWMTDDATDIAGNVRLQGGTVDIGAYEADASVVTLGIASELLEGGVGSAEYSLSVTGEYGSLPSGTRYAWDFDGDGTWDDYGLVVTHTFGEGNPTITMQAMDASGNPVAEPAVSAEAVDVKAKVVFVSATSTTAAYPYNTEETAAATLKAAFKAAGVGSEIRVGEGTYQNDGLSLGFKVTVRGAGDRAKTILRSTPCFSIMDADAVVENLTLRPGADSSGGRGTGVSLTAGTIRDCSLIGFNHTTPGKVAIDASGGLIDRCEIRDCYNNCDDACSSSGGVIGLDGTAVMRNSLVWRTPTYTSGAGINIIYVGPSARMENCVVYGTKSPQPAVKNAGTVVNCIMLNNVMTGASGSIGAPNWEVSGEGKFENCLSTVLGDPSAAPGILVGDPDFTAPADGDFTISSASIAFNAGKNLDWMAEAKDFYGNDRISGTTAEERGGIVDIGIHEVDIHAPDLNIAVTPVTGLGATEVTFTAVPNAFELSPDATFKWYLKDAVEEGDVPDSTANPFVTTLEPGTYSISLVVENADGKGKDYHRVKREVVTIAPTDIYIEAGEDFAAKVAPASDGTTVHLGEGTHIVSNQFVTTKALAFVGAGRGKTFLVNAADKTNAVLSIGNAASSVRDLTIRDAGTPMLTIAAGGGTVENVALTDARDSSTMLGGALRMMGGTLRLSYIQNNACAKSRAPIYLGGETAVLEDCLITGNSSTGTGADAVGAIRLARGIVRNCTITGNRSAVNAGGVVMTGEHDSSGGVSFYYTVGLINTIVWGNVCDVGSLYDNVYFPPVTDSNHYNAPNQFCKNNYTYPVLTGGTANIGSADDPGFVNAAKDDYRLQYGALARNKGLYEDWMATAVDLGGRPRSKKPAKGRVDIGCYETGDDGFLLLVK